MLALMSVLPCNENPICVFLFWELGGLSPNFPIHVFVSDLCIPRIGPHIPAAEYADRLWEYINYIIIILYIIILL